MYSPLLFLLLLSLTHCTKYHSNGIEWGRYHDLLHMAIIQEGVWIITALCLAICWLKLLFYVKVNLQMSMLINTIGAMINKLMSFFVIFAVVLLAFICFESVAFGYKVRLSMSSTPSIIYNPSLLGTRCVSQCQVLPV